MRRLFPVVMARHRGHDQDNQADIFKTFCWASAAGFCVGVWAVMLFRSAEGFLLSEVSVIMLIVLTEVAFREYRTMATAKTTIVTTAEGDAKAFGDFLSKFIVSHPKAAVIATAVVCLVAGFIFHV